MLRGDDAGLGAVSSPLARQHGSPSSASEIVNVGEQRSASPGIEQFPHLQQIHTKVQQFPRLAQLRAADVWERNMVNRALTQDPAGVVEDSPRGVGDGGHGSPLSTSGQSVAEAYGSEGPYFSENECSRNSSSRRLFHTVHGGNSFVNGSDTNTSVDLGGAGSDGNLIPSGSGRRRRNQRGNNSRKLLRLGSDFSSKALSLANPMNIVSAVQSTQSPNLRRHVVAAERLEKQFPYRATTWTPPGSKKDLTKALPNLGMGVWSPFRKGKQKTPSSARKMWNRMFPHGIVAQDPRAARVAAWEIVLIFSFSALIITVPAIAIYSSCEGSITSADWGARNYSRNAVRKTDTFFAWYQVELAYVNYSPENAWRPESRCAVVFWLIGRFFDAVFAIDVAVNFTTGFYHEHTRAYITSLSDVVPKYLGSWFLVDIAALVPSELFFRHGRATRLIKLLKLKHLAGSVRVDLRSSRIDAHVVELVQHVYLACAVIHVVCCMWSLDLLYQEQAGVERPFHERDVRDAYELGFDANGEPTNWVSANGVLGGRFEYYVAALQLLFQGEMRCANLTERCMLVVSMAMLYGLLIFILTEVMVLLGEINSMRGRYRALVRDMNSMMRDHGFPQVLRNRMRAYLRFRQTGSAGGLVNVPAERVVLNMLSPQLRVEAVLAMNKANVEAVPLFRQCAIPSDAIVILSVNAVVQVYAGHEFIFRTGEPADFMNCVNKGIVMAKGQMLCKGDTFGREAALGTRCAYTGSAFTLTNTTIVHLSSHSFFEMFKKFPDAELRVRKVLSQRMARDALMAYARYMRAIDAGRGEQFRKNIFNLGFSRTMLARMFLTRSNSIVEFLQMEKLVVQMQRAWRQRMARRRRHEEKLRARAERAGITPVVDRGFLNPAGVNQAGWVQKGFRFLDFGDVALLTRKETTEQRLDFIDTNQRAICESLRVITEKLGEMDQRSKEMMGGAELVSSSAKSVKRSHGGVLLM